MASQKMASKKKTASQNAQISFTRFVERRLQEVWKDIYNLTPPRLSLQNGFLRDLRQKCIEPKLRLCSARCQAVISISHQHDFPWFMNHCCHGLTPESLSEPDVGWFKRLLIKIPPPVEIVTNNNPAFIRQTCLMCFNYTNFSEGLELALLLIEEHNIGFTKEEWMACLRRGLESEIIYVKFEHDIFKKCTNCSRELAATYWPEFEYLIEEKMSIIYTEAISMYEGDSRLLQAYINTLGKQTKKICRRYVSSTMGVFHRSQPSHTLMRYLKYRRSSKTKEHLRLWLLQIAKNYIDGLGSSNRTLPYPLTSAEIRTLADQIDFDALPSVEQHAFTNCELISRFVSINSDYRSVLADACREYSDIDC